MSRYNRPVPGNARTVQIEKGTGDGLSPLFCSYQKKIREEEEGELIPKDTENVVSSVPRPLAVPHDRDLWMRGFSRWMDEPVRRSGDRGWFDDDDDCA